MLSSGSVTVTCIRNPFDPHGSRIIKPMQPGRTVGEFIQEFFPLAPPEMEVVASVNGRVVERGFVPVAGESMAFVVVPQGGGGGGGKNPIMTIVAVAASVALPGIGQAVGMMAAEAAFAAGWATTTLAVNIVGYATAALVGIAGSMVMSAVMSAVSPSPKADQPNYGGNAGVASEVGGGTSGAGFDTTTNYGWTPANAVQNGGAWPVLYGTRRVAPYRIGRYISTDGDKQYLALLFAVSDHEVAEISGVRINNNPVENYTGVTVETRLGTLNQSPVASFADTRSDIAVSAKLSTSEWYTVRLEGNVAQGLGVGITLPRGLAYYNDEGGLDSQTVTVAVEYRLVGGDWQSFGNYSISAATSTAIRRFYEIPVAQGQYEVRAKLTAAPPDTSRYAGDCYLDYVQSLIPDDFCYPGSSLLAVKAMATDKLSGADVTITCLARRDYVQVWNPATAAYENKPANNPAWAAYDAIHNDDYGGGVEAGLIVYADFAAWAAICEERGYTCNIYFDSEQSWNNALENISQAGRATVLQRGTKFSVVVDAPSDPVQLFNPANVVAGSFSGGYLKTEDRANCVEITYFDAAKDYQRTMFKLTQDGYEEDASNLHPAAATLFWCTSREQAAKYGRFLLNCNKYLIRTVHFEVGLDAMACTVGDVILVSSDTMAWGSGGRVVSAGASSVVLDRAVTMTPGQTHRILVRHQDDDSLEYATIRGVEVETTAATLTLLTPWAKIPAADAVYNFGRLNGEAKAFRILTITRGGDATRRRITALEYRAEVYQDDTDIPAYDQETSFVRVAGLTATETWVRNPDGTGRSEVNLSWRGTAISWNVYQRSGSGAWAKIGQTASPGFRVAGELAFGQTYSWAVSATANPADGGAATLTIQGKEAPPSDVTNFVAVQEGQFIRMNWSHIPDVDLWGYEIRMGAVWDTATVIVDGVQENSARWKPPLDGTYNLLIKAIDQSDNYSTNAALAAVSVDVEGTLNVVLSRDELSSHEGTMTNMEWDVGAGELQWVADSSLEGTYDTQPIDLGAKIPFSLRVEDAYTKELVDCTDLDIGGRLDTSFANDTDTSVSSTATRRIYYSVSDDGETWSSWAELVGAADCNARYFKVRVAVFADSDHCLFEFQDLNIIADTPEKEAKLFAQAIGSSGTAFDISEDFGLTILADYYVGVTVLGSAPLLWSVDKGEGDSFTVHLTDHAGNAVSGNVDVHLVGY